MPTTNTWQVASLVAQKTHLHMPDDTGPTSDRIFLTDGDERQLLVQTTASSKGKLTTEISVCHSRGAPYNAHAPGGVWIHGKAWNIETIVANFMYHLWPLAVEYWNACDYARMKTQQHYEDRCQIADALAAIGHGKASHPQFDPGNRDMVYAIHASGPNWRVNSFNSEVGYKLVLEIAASDAQALALIALLMEGDNPL